MYCLHRPRYTGYAIYGRRQKVEELLDPDDVAAGHVVRYTRSPASKIVRSREPAHPAIVSVEDFTRVQLEGSAVRSKHVGAGSGDEDSCRVVAHLRVARRIQCTICGGRMEGSHRSHATFYRCRAESCTALQDHPPNVYLREDYLTAKINSWVARLFDLARVQRTVEALADADELAGGIETQAQFRRRIAAAESTMERLRRAIEVGWDPEARTEQYNAAAADKRAAEAGLKAVDPVPQLTADDICAVVTQLGDMAKALDRAEP